MTQPLYITRSYGGGAVPAQLVSEIGASDLSFAITPTTGWLDENGNPLGTTGPFTVVIDRFTTSVEKILCSSVNVTTGVVAVYNSGGFNGRGFDGSTAQGHVPGGSQSGVQAPWSSVEAFEANAAVSYVLGTAGGTQSAGQTLQWSSGGHPVWGTPDPLGANPSGKAWCTSGSSLSTATIATLQASGLLQGSMVAANLGTTNSGLQVPLQGNYWVSGQMKFNNSGAVNFSVEAGITLNNSGSVLLHGNQAPYTTAAFVGSVVSGLVACNAGDVINLWYETNTVSGVGFQIDSPAGGSCFLCAALFTAT